MTKEQAQPLRASRHERNLSAWGWAEKGVLRSPAAEDRDRWSWQAHSAHWSS
jgi:hypothetical protein